MQGLPGIPLNDPFPGYYWAEFGCPRRFDSNEESVPKSDDELDSNVDRVTGEE